MQGRQGLSIREGFSEEETIKAICTMEGTMRVANCFKQSPRCGR